MAGAGGAGGGALNRYDEVAGFYDAYVATDFDLAFWRSRVRGESRPVLELMAGTGRVTGTIRGRDRRVVALDLSLPMLRKLRENVGAHGEEGPTFAVCADARRLPFRPGTFGQILLPFHSLAELTEARDRRRALFEVARCLAPGGTFVSTLHNPAVRTRGLDGEERTRGRFPVPDGRGLEVELWVRGERDPESDRVRSHQRYRLRGARGELVREVKQEVRFALVEPDEVEEMAGEAGLEIRERFGDYDRGPWDPETSPYAIQVFRKG